MYGCLSVSVSCFLSLSVTCWFVGLREHVCPGGVGVSGVISIRLPDKATLLGHGRSGRLVDSGQSEK